jgi:hypothetical protein
MDFDEIKQNILNSSETSTSESESISGSELHEEFEINNFLPEFEPLKLSGKNLAQQYVSAFNTGMNVYQCLNYLQGYVYTLVTAMNETIEAWNTVVPLLEQATKEWTDEEFDYKWSILKPQVIELVTNLTIETFNNAWEELKPVVIKLAQDTTDAEFKKQWDILKPQVITLVEETTTNKFNEEWEKLRPTIIQLSTDTTIEQFNRSWEELRPQVIELSQTTTNNKFDEKWEELRPQLIALAQTTTSNKFDEKWEALQPTLTETVNNLAKTQTITTFNEKWEELRPQVIELAQTTTNTKFDEKWVELQPTLTETVNNLVNTNLNTFKSTLWQEVTKNNDFPFLLPENFGAVGDGTTDDSTAFNSCFTKATETGKYVLLSNKVYSIHNKLNDISNINLIGINASIKLLGNIEFTSSMVNCNIKGINFYRDEVIQSGFVSIFDSSCLIKCSFRNLFLLFSKVSSHNSKHILLSDCNLHNTSLTRSNNEYTGTTYIINNTTFNIEHYSYFMYGNLGGTIIFNNCDINKNMPNDYGALFNLYDNIIFNDCNIKSIDNSTIFTTIDNDSLNNINISFNNCLIDCQNRNIINFTVSKNIYGTFKFINTKIVANAIAQGDSDLSLWIENCILNTNYVYGGIGNANIIEIQQKYSDTSQNVFPWISEIPSTYENNVKLINVGTVGTTDYYVLTESKDKNVKKLDYYLKCNFDYLPNAPYYTRNIFLWNLDLEGYTVKTSLLTNNTCKLKNKSTGELIDYVYLMLDDNVTVTTTKDESQNTITELAMKFLPYFAKLKTGTPATGQCYVAACISIILEKTSS